MAAIFQLDDKGTNGSGVVSPVDGTSSVFPLDYWATLYSQLAAAGVTVFKLPPMVKGASLGAGFDPMDLYDLGSKHQSGRRQTRFGSREEGQRNCAIGFRNGMEPAVHLVHHHCDGGNSGVYQSLGADGVTKNGRFPRDKNCFWYWSQQQQQNPDTVPDPQWDGGLFSYGDEYQWLTGTYGDGQGANGPGYVGRNLIEAAKWQLGVLGARQIIIDDLKGTSAHYIAWLCNTLWQEGLIDFAGGEYFIGDRSVLGNYISSYPIMNACGCFDFSQRFSDQGWCNSPGNYDMHQMLWNGLWQLNPQKALTFLDDVDTVGSEPVWRVWQGNAAILGRPGYPMIFGQHCYPADRGGFGLMDQILNLAWFRAKFCNGPFRVAAVAYDYIVYEYTQWPGGIIALSNRAGDFNNPNDWTQITFQSSYWGGTWLHNYSGLTNDVTVQPYGQVTAWLPPVDTSGRGFLTLAPGGFDGPIHLSERITYQTFQGAVDLDTPPATPSGERTTHIWSDAGREIQVTPADASVEYEVADEQGNVVIAKGGLTGQAKMRGWHRITAFSKTGGSVPYTVYAAYSGTKDLLASEFGDPVELRSNEVIASVDLRQTQHQWIVRENQRALGSGKPMALPLSKKITVKWISTPSVLYDTYLECDATHVQDFGFAASITRKHGASKFHAWFNTGYKERKSEDLSTLTEAQSFIEKLAEGLYRA